MFANLDIESDTGPDANRGEKRKCSKGCSVMFGAMAGFSLTEALLFLIIDLAEKADLKYRDAKHFAKTIIPALNDTTCNETYPEIVANYTDAFLCHKDKVQDELSAVAGVCYETLMYFCADEQGTRILSQLILPTFLIGLACVPIAWKLNRMSESYEAPLDRGVRLLDHGDAEAQALREQDREDHSWRNCWGRI